MAAPPLPHLLRRAHPAERDRVVQHLQNQLKQSQQQVASLKRKFDGQSSSSKDRGKGKDKGNKKRGGNFLADYRARGYAEQTKSGDRICFNYNMAGCPKAPDGERCDKGWHARARPF